MDARLLFERLQRVADSYFNHRHGITRRCDTGRMDGEFIRRRAEGALRRSSDGTVLLGVMLRDGCDFPFPTFLGAPYEEFHYLACEGQDLYLAACSFPDANGHMAFTSRLLPLGMVSFISFAWSEAVQARKAA